MFSLQQLVVDFSLIDRHHHLAKTNRHENDSEHSLAVIMLCWYIYDKDKPDLDIAKIFKYATAHDLVEVYAGDTNTFASKKERQDKLVAERKSLIRLSAEIGVFSDLVTSMHNYESKVEKEALFVWTVDKMQALIMGDMDDWRPYKELNISYAQFCTRYEELLSQSSPFCKELFAELIEYCKTTYYDRPV